MPQFSLPWPAPSFGDGASEITSTQLITAFRRMFGNGVFVNYGDELEVSGTASPLSVGYGAAVVNGFQYDATQDDAPYAVAVPTPTTGTTGHIVVVRADWAAQTVRLALRSSADGTAAFPSPVVNEGVVSEILLAQLTITTGGVITLTDARDFLYYHTKVDPEMIDSRTRTLFYPAGSGINTTDAAPTDMTFQGVLMPTNKHVISGVAFRCPADYASNLAVYPLVLPLSASGNIKYDFSYAYGHAGQGYNNTAPFTSLTTDTLATPDVYYELAALIASGVASSDYVTLVFERYGEDVADTLSDCMLVGFNVMYTADS